MHRLLSSSAGGGPAGSDLLPDVSVAPSSPAPSERLGRPRERRGALSGPPNSSFAATARSVGCLAVAGEENDGMENVSLLLVRLRWTRSGFQRLLGLLTEDLIPEETASRSARVARISSSGRNRAADALQKEVRLALSNCSDQEIELLATAAAGGTPAHRKRHGVAPIPDDMGDHSPFERPESGSHSQSQSHQRSADRDTVMSERGALPAEIPTPADNASALVQEGPTHSESKRSDADMDSTADGTSRLSFAEEGFLCEVWFNKEIPRLWRADHKRATALGNFMAYAAVYVIQAADERAEGERPPADLLSRNQWVLPCGPPLPNSGAEEPDDDGFLESKAVFCDLTRIPPGYITRARPAGERAACGFRHSTEAFLVRVGREVEDKPGWEVFGADTVESRWFTLDVVQKMWFTKAQRTLLDQTIKAYRLLR